MPPAVLRVVFLLALAACGAEIGDECILSADCSTEINSPRICDTASLQGYCTIQGCDHDTCPEEAVCVRFFTGSWDNRPCDPATEDIATDMCDFDEVCPLEGFCAPESSEIRFCMRKCSGSDECRTGYECRDLDLMREHGGEPVMPPGETLPDNPQKFCAQAPTT
jgi:hypothetical protein